jgi:outer membrane lipoprotein SlyB
MLIESRISDSVKLLIDCEAVGGVDKNAIGGGATPDEVLENAVSLIRATAERLGNGMSCERLPAPVSMEVEFAIRVDSNATVCMAQTPDQGQMRVRIRYDA